MTSHEILSTPALQGSAKPGVQILFEALLTTQVSEGVDSTLLMGAEEAWRQNPVQFITQGDQRWPFTQESVRVYISSAHEFLVGILVNNPKEEIMLSAKGGKPNFEVSYTNQSS